MAVGSYIDDVLWAAAIGDGQFNPDGGIYKYFTEGTYR